MSCGCSNNSYGAASYGTFGATSQAQYAPYSVPGSIEYQNYQYAAYYASMAQAMREVRAEEAAKRAQEAALLAAQRPTASDSAVQPLPMRLVLGAVERPWLMVGIGVLALMLVTRR
jgi:hypothetical protein